MVDGVAAHLLRGHVPRRAHDRALLGDGVGGVRLRNAEVEQLDAVARDDDVARLQVAMRDPLTLDRVERVGDLHAVLEHLLDRLRTLQGLALEVLHDEVIAAVMLADVDECADPRMLERRDDAGLAFETLAELRRRPMQDL